MTNKKRTPDIRIEEIEVERIVFNKKKLKRKKGAIQGENLSKLEIAEINNAAITMKNIRTISFAPSGPFDLEVVVSGRIAIEDPSEIEWIKENIEEVGFPLLSKSSFLVSFITDQFLGNPLVTAPTITNKEDENIEDSD